MVVLARLSVGSSFSTYIYSAAMCTGDLFELHAACHMLRPWILLDTAGPRTCTVFANSAYTAGGVHYTLSYGEVPDRSIYLSIMA